MSKSGILARVVASARAVIRTPLWVTMVSIVGVLTLVATALTVFSDTATTPGLDAGRMALSFDTLLVLAFALFTVPAIVDRIRRTTGTSGFLDAFVTAFLVGWSLIFAATPAFVWAIASTGVNPAVWAPALGSLKLEVLLVDVLVAFAFTTVPKAGTATAVAYAAISSLVFGPLLALGAITALPGVERKTTTWSVVWPDDQSKIDSATGYPKDPECPHPGVSTQTVPRYDLVWVAAPIIPFALVSESVEPKLATFVDTRYMGESEPITADSPKTTAPIDIFSTIAISSRALHRDQSWEKTINECERIAAGLDPWVDAFAADPVAVLDSTESGFTAGLMGQGVIVGAWIAGMLVIPRIRRKR